MKIKVDNVKEWSSSSNRKRLDSLKQKKWQYKAQTSLIKSALSQIDSREPVNKRILFESDDEKEFEHRQNSVANNKKKLFDDSDSGEEDLASSKDEEDDAFQIKPQFEGKKGEKLLALQSTFRNDERFQLDEKFIESDDEKESENEEKLSNCEGEDMSIMSERKRNLKILQDLTGIHMDSSAKRRKNQTFKDMNKLRYDPTREDAHRFEIKRDEKESGNRSKKRKQLDPEPIVLPEVSKNKYFEVAPDLKNHFTTNKSEKNEFSILKMFGNQNDVESEHEDSPYVAAPLNQTTKRLSCFDKNAFRYDSSDEEGQNLPNKVPKSDRSKYGSSRHKSNKSDWQFFFTKEDPRLKEGIEFFRKTETDKEISEWWDVARDKMLEIINKKTKVSKHKTPRRNRQQYKAPGKKGRRRARRKK